VKKWLLFFIVMIFLSMGNGLYAGPPNTKDIIKPPTSAAPPPPETGTSTSEQRGQCSEADKYMEKRQLDQALKALSACISKDKKNIYLYMKRGNLWAMKGDWNSAIKDFNKVIQLNPKFPQAYELRGLSKIKLGKKSEGLKDLDRAITLSPEPFQILSRKGNVLASMGKSQEAIEVFTKAIKLSPNFFGGYVNRANVYESLGEYSKALKDYDKAIKIESSFPPLYATRGLIRFYTGKFHEAIKDFQIANSKGKNNEQAELIMGLCFYRLHEMKKGEKVLSETYKTVSAENKPIVALFLGKISPSDFITHAGKNPYTQSTFWGFLGEYYLVHNNKKKAKESFKKCIELDPSCRNIPCRFAKSELKRLGK